MPYEATVPVPCRLLWSAVADPRRLFGALPGAVVEAADEHGAAGRLRLRVGQQTMTFRGIARIVEVDAEDTRAVVELEAAYGRNGGGVDGRLEILLREDGSETLVAVDGTLEFSGTAAAPSTQSLEAAGHRLLKRWFAELAESGEAAASESESELEPTPELEPESAEAEPAPEPDSEPETLQAEAVSTEPEPEPTPEPTPELAAPASETAAAESEPAETAAPEPEPKPELVTEPVPEAAEPEPTSAAPETDEPAQPAAFGSRPPLAVVPDLDLPDGEPAGPADGQAPLPQRKAQPKPSASAKSRAAESVSGGSSGRPHAADFETGAAAVDRDAPARLHLVQPTGGEPEGEDDAADDDEPDIWSRRKPFLPRWLPYLAGATFVGAVAFLIAVLGYLRRLRRARQD
jgi:carbon monoxide dehydrogenase subunit G